MESGYIIVERSITKAQHVFLQHTVHCLEAAHCKESVLMGRGYKKSGSSAPRGVEDEVNEGRMYDFNYAMLVLWNRKHRSEPLKYTPRHSRREKEERVEGCRRELVQDKHYRPNDHPGSCHKCRGNCVPKCGEDDLEI